MLWRRLSEWLELRSAVRDLKRGQRDEEGILMRSYPNPLQVVRTALNNGDLENAASAWERAKLLLPKTTFWSNDAVSILLDLKRYDEAEALMQRRHRRVPTDIYCQLGLANVAMRRGDFVEAAKRWTALRERAKQEPEGSLRISCLREGYLQGGLCSGALGKQDEAEIMLGELVRLGYDDLYLLSERARLSERREDWSESFVRWKLVSDRFKFGAGFAGQARSLVQLGRVDEVEALVEQSLINHVPDHDIAEARAYLARHRADRAAAAEGGP
jgi:tetratricopeptide (TPR) repeat protein